jgi:hypothetical protein
MGFLDKAKAAAEQAANRANETVADVQTKRELTKAYGELGESAYKLADSGAISHPELEPQVTRIRELQAKLDEDEAGRANGGAAAAEPTEAVEQPLSGAGPGAA